MSIHPHNPSMINAASPASISLWRLTAAWIADHELLLLPVAGLPLLFPRGPLPWVGVALFVLLWACRRIKTGALTIRTGLDTPALLLMLMAGVGVFISLDRDLSGPRFWSLVLGVLAFYTCANLERPGERIRFLSAILAALTLGIAALSLVGTDWQSTRMISLPWLYDRLPALLRGLPGSGAGSSASAGAGSELFNARWVGITMGLLAPVFLALLFYARDRRVRLLAAVVAIVTLLLLVISQSLQGLLGLGAGLFFLLVWRSRWFWLLIPLGLAGAWAGLAQVGPDRAAAYLLSIDNPAGIAVVLRLDIWSRALAMLADMPYTGGGLNTFPLLQAEFYPGFLLGREPHAHNLYLQTALDLGLPGLFAFLWLIVAWFGSVRAGLHRTSPGDGHALLLGLAAGVISYLAHGLMDAMMLGSKPGVAVWMLLGLGTALAGGRLKHSAVSRPIPRRSPRRAIGLPLALLLTGLGLYALARPGSVGMNTAVLHAHRGLLIARQSGTAGPGLSLAAAGLQRSLEQDPANPRAHGLLAEIAAWQGDYGRAVRESLAQVERDGRDPFGQYNPAEDWLRELGLHDAGAGRLQDLYQVYAHWTIRYPQRALYWLWLSQASQFPGQDPGQARAVLRSGLEHSASPAGLLDFSLRLLDE